VQVLASICSSPVFESNTAKDLLWFFDDFMSTTERLDKQIQFSKTLRDSFDLAEDCEISGRFTSVIRSGEMDGEQRIQKHHKRMSILGYPPVPLQLGI
jgi:hypothetical protein